MIVSYNLLENRFQFDVLESRLDAEDLEGYRLPNNLGFPIRATVHKECAGHHDLFGVDGILDGSFLFLSIYG